MENNIYNSTKLGRTEELEGKTGVLVGLDLCSAGRRTEAWGPIPTSGQRSQRRKV